MRRRRWPFWPPFLALTALLSGGVVWWLYVNTSLPYRLETLRGLLEEYTAAGDLAAAAAALERIVELEPQDQHAALRLAELYQALERQGEAELLLRRYLEQYPQALRFRLALAGQLIDEARLGEAYGLIVPELPRIEDHPDVGDRAKGLILAGELLAARGELEQGLRLIERGTEMRESHGLRAQEVGDDRALGLLAQGRVLEQAGQLDEAVRALRAAVEIAPDGLRARLQLGHALAAKGDVDDAERTLLDFYALGGERRTVVVPLLARVLVQGGAGDRAQALAQRLESDGEPALAAYTRGLAALEQGELAEARTAFAAMAKAEPRSTAARLELARTELRAGVPDAARAALERALAVSPELTAAALALLELEVREGDAEAARERAVALLQQPAARQGALHVLLALAAAGDTAARDEAISALDTFQRRSPYDLALTLYATLLRAQTGDEAALARLAELAVDPSLDLDPPLGLLALGQPDQARQVLEAVAALSDAQHRLAPVRLLLGRAYLALGLPARATEQLDRALAAKPEWRAARLARVRLAWAQGDLELAATQLEQLRELDLRDAEVLEALADVRLRQGRHDQALALLNRACQLLPESGRALARLARAEALAGKERAADKTFADAQRMSPEEPLVYQNGGVALLTGDAPAAVAALKLGANVTGAVAYEAAWGAALALRGRPGAALAPIRHWLTGRRSPAGLLTLALLTQRAGDATAADALAGQAVAAGAPPAVVEAARVAPAPVVDWSLRAFGLLALDWLPDAQRWLRSPPAEVADHPLYLWWALHGSLDAGARAQLATRLAQALPAPETGLLLARTQVSDVTAQLATLRALDAAFPEDPRVGLALAAALERSGDGVAALARLEALAAGEQPDPLARNNLAWALRDAPARQAEAIAHARAAVGGAPGLAAARDTLGWLLFRAGAWDEAQLQLTRAVDLAPGRSDYRLHLAACLAASGQVASARLHWRTARLGGDATLDAALLAEVTAALDAPPGDVEPKRLPVGSPQRDLLAPGQTLRWQLAATGADRVVELRGLAPPGSELSLALAAGPKRFMVGPSGQLSLPALLLPSGGVTLELRGGAPGPVELALELRAADAEPRAHEPDETTATAQPLAAGGALAGGFDGPGDRDHLALALSEAPQDLRVEAGPRGPLRLELLACEPSRKPRLLRQVALDPGQAVVLRGLVEREPTLHVLRLTGVQTGLAADGVPDWRAVLTPAAAAAEREPNDVLEDALPLSDLATGQLDPADPVDWYRVPASAGAVWCLTLEGEGLTLEVWSRGLIGDTREHRADLRAGPTVRWRVDWATELYLAVRGDTSRSRPYRLRAEREAAAPPSRELEPNDDPSLASPVSSPGWEGSLASPADTDWVSLEPGVYALELNGPVGSLRLYQDAPERPNLLLTLAPGPTGLAIPALRVPERGLLALAGVAEVATYAVLLSPLDDAPGLEVEPNDAIDQAQELPLSIEVSGALSGADDRDLLELPARARSLSLTVEEGELRAGFLGEPLERVTPAAPFARSGLLDDRVLVVQRGQDAAEAGLQRYRVRSEP